MSGAPRDPWAGLSQLTPARIAIGRAGASLPTRDVLAFALAHARARDAIDARFDRAALATGAGALGLATVEVESLARERAVYLRRPDLGRRLDAASRDRLEAAIAKRTCDIALVVADGLSPLAVVAHALPLLEALLPHLVRLGLAPGPVALAEGARVALGDEIGRLLGARFALVLIGERPGLSATDSMSAYLTFDPRAGRHDAERNCVSNIRAGGLAPREAAHNLAWLVGAALQLGATGVGLKDGSGAAVLAEPGQPAVARMPPGSAGDAASED